MTITIVANPKAGGGRTAKRLDEVKRSVEARLGPTTLALTTGMGEATRLTRDALHSGSTLIIAVGGDGTINECVNGFFENNAPINAEAALGFVNAGTGGDFRRTFGLAGEIDDYVGAIADAPAQHIDLGLMQHTDWNGQRSSRLFNNIASFGLSGRVDQAVNEAKISKLFGGTFAFFWGTLTTMMTFRAQEVRLQVDDHYDETRPVNMVAVCNGQFFGGGIPIGPMADPTDGTFEVVSMGEAGFFEMLGSSGSMYKGDHLTDPKVNVTRGRKVMASAINHDDVLIDADGETPGMLAAEFEVLPRALRLRCPAFRATVTGSR